MVSKRYTDMNDRELLVEIKISLERAILYLAKMQVSKPDIYMNVNAARYRVDEVLKERQAIEKEARDRHSKSDDSQDGLF